MAPVSRKKFYPLKKWRQTGWRVCKGRIESMRMSDQTLYDYELQGKPAIELPLNAPVVRQVFDIFDRIIVKPCKKIGIDAAVFLYKMATCMPE